MSPPPGSRKHNPTRCLESEVQKYLVTGTNVYYRQPSSRSQGSVGIVWA